MNLYKELIDNLYERWIKPFYGVSTKYLGNYLNWFMFLQNVKNKTNQALELAEIILSNKKAKKTFKEIESMYQILINPQLTRT